MFHLLRTKFDDQISAMREEFLKETASKEEQYRKTLYEYEEKLYEVQERSTNSSENTETPRVK